MIHDHLLFVLLFWGTWLLIPAVTDGVAMLWHMLLSFQMLRHRRLPPLPSSGLPKVSVIIPAYNEQLNINYCLMSLKAQTYPHRLIEIIVVDDGSSDLTSDIVLEHMGNGNGGSSHRYLRTSSFTISLQDFGGVLNLVRRKRNQVSQHGKPAAVNAGLALATGELIVAIDSDVVLEPDAIEQAVRAFLADDKLLAATGHLIVDPYLVVQTDDIGRARTDANDLPLVKALSFNERLLSACQFLEYATAFHLGRRAEGVIDGMFTLAGACAVFRREVLACVAGYRGRTVSEDTDLTMTLHGLSEKKVGYLSNMRVHLSPVTSWSRLYSQRMRWQRGALEVSAMHLMVHQDQRAHRLFWSVLLPLRLQVDHTLTLPRLMWTFLIFVLPLFGYAWALVGQALGLLFIFYLLVNVLRVLVAYVFSSPPEKVLIRRYLGAVVALPLYNMFLFWTRTSANIRTLTEDAAWTVHNPLLENLESIDMHRMAAYATRLFHDFL
jgi:biofilm PGA synthesis N-glycosyltransferase PgaC